MMVMEVLCAKALLLFMWLTAGRNPHHDRRECGARADHRTPSPLTVDLSDFQPVLKRPEIPSTFSGATARLQPGALS